MTSLRRQLTEARLAKLPPLVDAELPHDPTTEDGVTAQSWREYQEKRAYERYLSDVYEPHYDPPY